MHNQALKEIKLYLQDELNQVEEIIESTLKSDVRIIKDVTNHIMKSGGKKIRPIFTIASGKLLNNSVCNEDMMHIAATIELIHNATLLHDDVVDNNELRRGQNNPKGIWGNQISVLMGDLLLSVAFSLLTKRNNIEAISALSEVAFLLAEGEIRQLTNTGIIISEKEYLKTITLKTASLFAVACKMVAIFSKEEKLKKTLYDFGLNIGIAFQIIDDIIDYDDSPLSGKTMGNDFYSSKVTLPVILSYESGTELERRFWKNTFEKSKEKDLEQAIKYLEKNNVFTQSLNKAQVYVNNCLKLLEPFPDSEIKRLLKKILQFTLNREF